MSDGDVIDWEEAMDQCGDDEEFLRELLSDLREEIDAQLVKIEDALKTVNDQSFLHIMRASHVIKGASSNLMCGQLRETATNLEQGAAAANQIETSAHEAEILKENVKKMFEKLKTAVDNYHKFLDSVGI
uniref:HPt domain-containing protein n=1 Tax=Skeletonema marinoi TaxID=267567 RepID=A0A6T5SUL8_9STRA|mmetsp:Transcript_275/g.344  ORF Transcript_275/g.344 Transcript_275/m.344 type:complete len:130 (+) Transcript_275:58-447(+)